MRKPLLLAALLFPFASFASTDCTSTVAKLVIETAGKGSYTVTLSSGIAFVMKPSVGSYRDVLTTVQTTTMMAERLTARFAGDVDCNARVVRSDLVALIRDNKSDNAMMITDTVPPPSTMRQSSPTGSSGPSSPSDGERPPPR